MCYGKTEPWNGDCSRLNVLQPEAGQVTKIGVFLKSEKRANLGGNCRNTSSADRKTEPWNGDCSRLNVLQPEAGQVTKIGVFLKSEKRANLGGNCRNTSS